MAISAGSIEGKIRANFVARGFALDGEHSRGGDMAKAVGKGVANEVNASAVVIVPSHAGGTYKVTGLSAGGMFSIIKASLTASGFLFGEHSKANVMPSVISEAVTNEILTNCTVTIPYDGSGSFQIVGVSASGLEQSIRSGLLGEGFNTGKGDNSVMCYAVAAAVADEINGSAIVSGSFVSGGTFPVL